jgi:hypothetical protein
MPQAYKFEFIMEEPEIILTMLCHFSMVMKDLEMWEVELDETGEEVDDDTASPE